MKHLPLSQYSDYLFFHPDVVDLVKELGLVPSASPWGRALSCYNKIRFCELYKRAKAAEMKEFQIRFHARFKKYARVDHNESQLDCCTCGELF